MPQVGALTLDNIRPLPKAALRDFICTLSDARMHQVCRALSVAVDC